MKTLSPVLSLICITVISIQLRAQPSIEFQAVDLEGPGLVDPVDIASAGDGSGRLFIAEKRGTVRVIENDTVLSQFFLDVRPDIATSGEAGLLGIAFHPDYPATPYVFINYVKPTLITWVSRFTVDPLDPNVVINGSETLILAVDQPWDNHNAGDIAFGPDGYLYITMGDGGLSGDPQENAQDPEALLGKILRIDIDSGSPYGIPPDNPFAGSQDTLEEIWAFGMRNPWRMSFDRETGDLWIADVGQGMWEELDFEPAGSGGGLNYGWDCYEGDADYEGTGCGSSSEYVFPVFVYPHNCTEGCPYGTGNSITGGFVYRGQQFESMQGYYFCVDYVSENIWVISYDGSSIQITNQSGAGEFNQMTTFGEDDNGELYAASLQDLLYRVVPEGFLPVYLTHFSVRREGESVLLQWKMENMQDVSKFTVERSMNGVYFKSIGTLAAEKDEHVYTFIDTPADPALYYYRVVYKFYDGASQISPVRSIDLRTWQGGVQIRTMANGNLGVVIPAELGTGDISLYQSDGKLVTRKEQVTAFAEIAETEGLIPGVYVVVVETLQSTTSHKWMRE